MYIIHSSEYYKERNKCDLIYTMQLFKHLRTTSTIYSNNKQLKICRCKRFCLWILLDIVCMYCIV